MNDQRHDWQARAAGSGVQPQYWAFLSYSHRDKAFADWLHNALESYRIPKALVGRETKAGRVPEKLSPVFRDRFELAASDDLGGEIRAALAGSRYLVVLCSPDAARSRWTNEEIRTFKQLHPESRVLAAIVAGEPFASRHEGGEARECFPEALRHRYDEQGRQLDEDAEPIAADFRAEGDGKRLGLLKLIAGMVGVGLDELIQREAVRRQKRLVWVSAASLLGMAVASGLAIAAVDARDEARDQRTKAEELIGFMLGDLRGRLEPLGRLDVLDSVGTKALDYYRGQDKGRLSDEALTQRSRALTLIGEIANRRGNLDAALSRYREALSGTEEALRRDPQNGQRIFDHAQNVFWVGYIAWQRGQSAEAERQFLEYRSLARQMLAIDPHRPEWRMESVYADSNLGTLLNERQDFARAVQAFQSALATSEAIAAADPRSSSHQVQVAEALASLSDAQEGLGRLDEAMGSRERQIELLGRLIAADPSNARLRRAMAVAEFATADLIASRGEVEPALERLRSAARHADELRRTEPENVEWLEVAGNIHFELAQLLLAAGRAAEAGPSSRTSCEIAQRLVRRDSTVASWRLRGLSSCFVVRARASASAGRTAEARALARQAVDLFSPRPGSAPPADLQRGVVPALIVLGEQDAASGDAALARSRWTQALATLDRTGSGAPRYMAFRLRLLQLLGRTEEAARIAARLGSIGYQHPAYLPPPTGAGGRTS